MLESSVPEPRAAADAVKEAVRLGSWPLEDILRPWDGMPEAPGMFAISWLDLRRLPVRVDATGLEAQYVGATIRTDGVMLWFILDESGLHLRCRYPDTVEARRHVGGWLDLLIARLQARARESVGGQIRLGDRSYRVQRAGRSDVPAIVGLLSDEQTPCDGAELARYEEAYDAVARDPSHYLAVVRDEVGRIVGTMQLTIVPGLFRGGATRLLVEGIRVASSERSRGIGTAMLAWAHDHGRNRGATLAQIAVDASDERARMFGTRLGYGSTQVGLERTL